MMPLKPVSILWPFAAVSMPSDTPISRTPQWINRRRACSDSMLSRESREKSSTSSTSNCFALASVSIC